MSESNIDSIVLRNQNVIEYNKGITGIDRLDQILACFPVMRKCMKRYRKIFFYLFNLFCLTTTYILFNKINTSKKKQIYGI